MAADESTPTEPVPVRADPLCQILAAHPTPEAIDESGSILGPLRELREFARLCDLAELVCRFRLDDADARRFCAQGLSQRNVTGPDLVFCLFQAAAMMPIRVGRDSWMERLAATRYRMGGVLLPRPADS